MRYLLAIAMLLVATAACADDTVPLLMPIDFNGTVITNQKYEWDVLIEKLTDRIAALERRVAEIERKLTPQYQPMIPWYGDTWIIPMLNEVPCDVRQ